MARLHKQSGRPRRNDVCGAVAASECWARLMSDPAATNQRWYCCVLGVRYKTKFGMLMETLATATGASAIVRANVTDQDAEGSRAIEMEKKLTQPRALAAQELYGPIPMAAPARPTDAMRPRFPREFVRNPADADPGWAASLCDGQRREEQGPFDWDAALAIDRDGLKSKKKRRAGGR